MKVAVLNPPYFALFSRESRSPSVTKSSTLYWPMFLAYAAGSVEEDGNEILFLDSPAMDLNLEETVEKIKEFGPEAAILNCSTPSINNDMRVGRVLKEQIGCHISLMGTHATAEPVGVLEKESAIDSVIMGEADYTARELIRCLRGDGPSGLGDVPGLSWRDQDKIVRNEDRPKIENLDDLPWVSKVYHKHLYSCYKRYYYGANLNPLITILSGRGCPFRCTYCVFPQTLTGHTYRTRSVKDVADEMEFIYDNFEEVGEIFFEDDTFTALPKRTAELCEEMISRGRDFTWSGNARDDVKLDLLKIMKKSGCREVCVGFESASDNVLKNVKKGSVKSNARKFMENANKAGVIVHGCFMVGNSGETADTMRATLDMAKDLNPLTAQFYPIMAYPGTEAYEEAKKNNELASEDFDKWLDEEGHHNTTVIRKGLTSQQLVDFCDNARREFYLRPKYIFKAIFMSLGNKKERYRIFRGANTLFRHLFKSHGKDQETIDSKYKAGAKTNGEEIIRYNNGKARTGIHKPQVKSEAVTTDQK